VRADTIDKSSTVRQRTWQNAFFLPNYHPVSRFFLRRFTKPAWSESAAAVGDKYRLLHSRVPLFPFSWHFSCDQGINRDYASALATKSQLQLENRHSLRDSLFINRIDSSFPLFHVCRWRDGTVRKPRLYFCTFGLSELSYIKDIPPLREISNIYSIDRRGRSISQIKKKQKATVNVTTFGTIEYAICRFTSRMDEAI